MTNLYSKITLDKIKDHLDVNVDIPLDIFKSAIMKTLGTNYKNTEIWVRNYEEAKLINISKNNGNCWVVNWL
jgi:hypothetical protein